MDERNPYAPPRAEVRDVYDVVDVPSDLNYRFIPNGRSVPISAGVEWIVASWQIFRRNPGLWILALIIGYGALIPLALIPVVNVLLRIASPLLTGGLAAMADASRRGHLAGIKLLFEGFRKQTGPLLVMGTALVALMALPILMLVAVDGPSWGQIALGFRDPALFEGRLLMTLVYLTITGVLGLLVAFAPALVLLDGVRPLPAIRMSALGVVKNLLPGILCAFAFGVLFVASIIPLALGLFVTVPMMTITIYAAYHDIFHEATS